MEYPRLSDIVAHHILNVHYCVFSANFTTLIVVSSSKLFIYVMKNIGPNSDACKTVFPI